MPRSPRSLRSLYLRSMLQVLLPVLIIGATLSYWFASRNIYNTYDLDLLDDANDLLSQVQIHSTGHMELDLPLAAREMLLTNNEENVIYAVWDDQGKLLSGNPNFFAYAAQQKFAPSNEATQFKTVIFDQHHYRMVIKQQTLQGHTLSVAVAQTTTAIDNLLLDVLVGFILFSVTLIFVSVLGIFSGVRQGLVPVARLRDAIAARTPGDFNTLPESSAPEELQPIIHGINELLLNLEKSVLDHRRFVADAAHQLRTPLAVLTSKLETALQAPNHINLHLIEQLLEMTQRTSHLASQLLSLSRLENAHQMEAHFKTVDLANVLRDAAAQFVITAEQQNITLHFDLTATKVIGDQLLLEEVFSNLLDNAFRYSGRGSTVQVSTRSRGNTVDIICCDNGTGVTDEQLSHLGEPFFRAAPQDGRGCGLGLAIVGEIMHLHHGNIHYSHSPQGHGLCITLNLPAA